ncbi:MAG: DOMON-like domain-containing protein [Chloroflexi bacterium]|nr:DOMON-like domain-containing protein [Chloroflexota bacterium]
MTQQIFDLRPFPGSNVPTDVRITTRVERRSNLLTVRYSLKDSSSLIAIPLMVDPSQRKSKLWEETCFECFAAKKPGFSNEYWEFNLSPSGNWNVYRFDAYRQAMKAEVGFSALPFRVNRAQESLTLEVEIDLGKIGLRDVPVQVGITAVVKLKTGDVSYWALAHCGKQPDFHLRESFVIEL